MGVLFEIINFVIGLCTMIVVVCFLGIVALVTFEIASREFEFCYGLSIGECIETTASGTKKETGE